MKRDDVQYRFLFKYIMQQTCHLLTKEWKNNVECKVNSKEAHAILATLKHKISDLFDYPDTVKELAMFVNRYKAYYNSVKDDLNSGSACESIEEVYLKIENNFQYVAHFYFKDVCTFDFKGDSIFVFW